MAFVQEPNNELLIHSVDEGGFHATTQYFVGPGETDPAAGGAADIVDAVQGMSTDYVYSAEILIRAVQTAAVTPTAGPYDRVQDKVQVVMNSADGSPVIFQLPCPNEGIFGADAVKIDPLDASVIALVAALVANATTAEGAALTTMARGFRRRPTRLKHQ